MEYVLKVFIIQAAKCIFLLSEAICNVIYFYIT